VLFQHPSLTRINFITNYKQNKMKNKIINIAMGLLVLNISTTSPVFSQSVKESEDGRSCTNIRSDIKGKNEKVKPNDLCLTFNYSPTNELSNPNVMEYAEQLTGSQVTESTNDGFYSDDCYRDGEKWYCPSCRRFHTCSEFKNCRKDEFNNSNRGRTFYYRNKCLDKHHQRSNLSKGVRKHTATWEYPKKAIADMTDDELIRYFECTCCGSELEELLKARAAKAKITRLSIK
jgi:hypothetical protein